MSFLKNIYHTNTPRIFHVEMTWKRSFPRRFNVKYTWCIYRVLSTCDFYGGDLNKNSSETQLSLIRALFEDRKTSIEVSFIIKRLRKLTHPQKVLLSEVTVLIKLLLLGPSTNTVSERFCSTLRKMKTYLRTTRT